VSQNILIKAKIAITDFILFNNIEETAGISDTNAIAPGDWESLWVCSFDGDDA
jgi:hypothetical protein